jgi:hypothetical protein
MFPRQFFSYNKNITNVIQKSHLWNLSKNSSIGFIESIYEKGYIMPSKYVLFRESGSMHYRGNIIKMSIEKLPYQYKEELISILSRKIPIYVEYSNDLVGSPTKGGIIYPYYANIITPLSYDVLHVKNLTYGQNLIKIN